MNRICELRKSAGMKQLELADLLNVTRQAISRYEIGDREIGPDLIFRLCQIFHVTADYLLGFSDFPAPAVSAEDAHLIAAYHAAPEQIRAIVDTALEPYQKKKITAAG